MKLVLGLFKQVLNAIAVVILLPFTLIFIGWQLLTEYRMEKARRDYENSDYYKSLNHDKCVPCAVCGRLPEVWEEAFAHKICEGCYEDWLDARWEKEHGKSNA